MIGKIRVIIADDHPAFREGLCRLLGEGQELEVVGQAADGEEAVNLSKTLNPDVAIIDVSMPKLNGIEATRQIKESSPDTAVLIVSAYQYQSYILASIRAGAIGYLTKDTPLDELLGAVRMAKTGAGIIGSRIAKSVMPWLVSGESDRVGNLGLHPREIEVLKLTAKGMSNKEIACALNISDRTVQSHMVNIFNKLDVGSRTEAVLQGLKYGWLDVSELSK